MKTHFHQKLNISFDLLQSGNRQLFSVSLLALERPLIFLFTLLLIAISPKMDKLPPEILLKIAENLSPGDLISFSGANQRIFETVANDNFMAMSHQRSKVSKLQ